MTEKNITEPVQNHDFIEIDYTGKLPDGTVFDTTVKAVAEKNNLQHNRKDGEYAPLIICVGEQQILPGLDAHLIGKEPGKAYTITLGPEQAFGKRDVKKIKIMPADAFREHDLAPYPGLQVDADGEIGTVMKVSGGRVIVNFNSPLAGREVVYEVEIKRKVADAHEQLQALIGSLLRIPKDKCGVEIQEQKARVTLPFEMPAPMKDIFSKKLAELTKLQEVTLEVEKKKTIKQE